MMRAHIRYFESGAQAATAAALFIIKKTGAAIESSGRAALLLAGGSAPKLINAELLKLREKIDVTRIEWYFGDERAVDPDSPESNFRMQWETLLAPLGVETRRVHRIRGELGARRAADDYRSLLSEMFEGSPVFDLVMLGIGPDGHTASLFPGDLVSLASGDVVTSTSIAALQPYVERISVTLPVINRAKSVLFFTGYNGKEQMIDRLSYREEVKYPFEMVNPESGPPEWFIYRSQK